MRINKKGIDIIKKYEGLRLKPYLCPAGLMTIGYGHVIQKNEYYLYDGLKNASEAEELLLKDVEKYEDGVLKIIRHEVLNENRFSALVSFSFNVGLGALKISTLRQRLNRGEIAGAAEELLKWCRVRGVILKGLLARRIEEKLLFDELI